MKRIKKYSWKWIVIGLTVAVLFVVPFVVGAEDNNVFDEPISEKVAGIELAIKRWDLSHYVPITNTDDSGFFDSKIVNGMNNIAGFFFSMTKTVAQIIDTGISYLYSLDAVNLMTDKVANISKILWDNLYASFGTLFFLLAVLQIFFIFSVKRNSQEAMKRAFSLFLVIGLSVVWFSNAGWYMKAINNVTNEIQGVVMKAGTAFTTGTDEEIEKGKELDGSLAIMRNAYFELIVEKPYLMMNYGTPNKEEILQDDANRIDDLLAYRLNDEGLEKKEKAIDKEIGDYGNASIASSNVANQMGIAFISLLFAIVLGIPLLLVAFLNLLLQILALALSIVLPVTIMLSFLPSFVNSAWNTLGKLIGVFMMKTFVGMTILFVFLVITIIDTIIPATNTGMYFLNLIAIAASIIFMILNRNQLIKLFTGGMVAKVDHSKVPEKAWNGVKNKIKNSWKGGEREGSPDLGGGNERVDTEDTSVLNRDTAYTNESDIDSGRDILRTSQMNENSEVRNNDERANVRQEISEIEDGELNDINESESSFNETVSDRDMYMNEKDTLDDNFSDEENIIHLAEYLESRKDRLPQEEFEEVEDVLLYQSRPTAESWDIENVELTEESFDRLPQEELQAINQLQDIEKEEREDTGLRDSYGRLSQEDFEDMEDTSLKQNQFGSFDGEMEMEESFDRLPQEDIQDPVSVQVIEGGKRIEPTLRETSFVNKNASFERKELGKLEGKEHNQIREYEERFMLDENSLREEGRVEEDTAN